MKESAPHQPNQEVNIFELVNHNGISVPRYLLENDREADLQEYTRGWNAQKQRITTKLVYGNVDNYYDLGAVKYWTASNNATEYESETTGGLDLDVTLKGMRTNLRRIPKEAWSNEDFGSDRIMDNGSNNQSTGSRYYSPETITSTDTSTKGNLENKAIDSDNQAIAQ